MAAIPYLLASALLLAGVTASAAPLTDRPVVWYDADDADIPLPEERDPNLLWDGPLESVVRPFGRWTKPSRQIRRLGALFGGDHVRAAPNVNAVGEVPNNAWFTNRIGLFEWTPEQVAAGVGADGPSRDARWIVVSAKTQGVTPGFNIRDANGNVFLIKFDPPEFPGMASGAGVISNRLLHAAGYNVPNDHVVYFERDDLVLDDGVQLKLPDGSRRLMTDADLDRILSRVHSVDGRWRAISSQFIRGTPIGPFDYQGRRDDDPNDRIPHQDRRELRGLYVFAAWLAHFDTKQHNSLDMYVEQNDRHFVRHYLIDFASTLGTGARGPTHRKSFEFTLDAPPVFGRVLALGLHEDAWRRLSESPYAEIGNYEAELFDPREYKPLQPNPAFANLTDRDAYWATKIMSAFSDDHVRAAVAEARYEEPGAADYLARMISARRDRIVRYWFGKVPPLEYPVMEGARVTFRDLGVERGVFESTPRYRARFAACGADRDVASWSPWRESETASVTATPVEADPSAYPFLAVAMQVDRGEGFSSSVLAYFSRESGRLVAVDRD